MRDKLILIWRKLTTIKILRPLIFLIRKLAATRFFNFLLDGCEAKLFHTSYAQTMDYFETNKERIMNNVKLLADQKSVCVYENILRYRSTHNRHYLKGIVDADQYFDKQLIILGEHEGFVDGGGYRGDTVKQFKRHLPTKDKFEFIIAFEPDPYNYKALVEHTNKDKERILCYQYGTWSRTAKMNFKSNTEEGCMISDEGDCIIEVRKIDDFCDNRDVTYIKMDVEGSELESLIGSKRTIERCHPRLAISIYHTDEDMLRIIEYIHAEYPFYELYIRHYTWFYADTVLYAIDPRCSFR